MKNPDPNPEDEAFEELSKRQGDWGLQGSRKHQIMRYVENVESKGTSMTDKAQRTEQNFCPRCGKRTKDLTHIHTCTPPPQENI